jgi:hypothetical protein
VRTGRRALPSGRRGALGRRVGGRVVVDMREKLPGVGGGPPLAPAGTLDGREPRRGSGVTPVHRSHLGAGSLPGM